MTPSDTALSAQRGGRGGLRQRPSGLGATRAAAVVLALGPELAGTVFRYLDEPATRHLAVGARALKESSPETVNAALRAFVDHMEGHGTDLVAGDTLLKDMLRRALGDDAAERAFAEEQPREPPNMILGPLAEADPEDLALLLAKEHPQTCALILSAMDADAASVVLQKLPEENQARILHRVARVDSVSPDVLADVVSALLDELEAMGSGSARQRLDGKAAAIELLRRFPSSSQGVAIEEIEQVDPSLADELRNKLFTFEDVLRLSDRDVQTLLREIDVKQLTVALKGASEGIKEKLIANMSRRVAQMLLEDLEMLGPVRLSDVEKAQEAVARVALTLAEEGRVTIAANEEMV